MATLDDELQKTAIRTGTPPSGPVRITRGDHAALEKAFRGYDQAGLERLGAVDKRGAVAKEMGRRTGIRFGFPGYDPLSREDMDIKAGQKRATTADIADNWKGAKDLQGRVAAQNAAAAEGIGVRTTALTGYAPSSNPDLTQQYRPMTDSRMKAQADTKAYQAQQREFETRRFARNNLERIPGPEGQVEAFNPNKQPPKLRSGAGAMTPEMADAKLAAMKDVVTTVPAAGENRAAAEIGPARPTKGQRAASNLKSAMSFDGAGGGKGIRAGGVVSGLLSAYEGVDNQVALNDQTSKIDRAAQAAEDVSKASMASLGATAGASYGAALGSPLGPLGAAAGGIIGGIGGGALGYFAPEAAISFGRRATNGKGLTDWSDPGSPIERQQAAGTADKTLFQRGLNAVDNVMASRNDPRDALVPSGAAVPTAQQSSAGRQAPGNPAVARQAEAGLDAQSGGVGGGSGSGGGSGVMTDNMGRKAVWNPQTQQFDGVGGTKVSRAPVNSAGQMFKPQGISAGIAQGAPATGEGRGAVLLRDTEGGDAYSKILNDPRTPAAVKAKLQMKLDALAQGDRRTGVDERQQALAENLGVAKFGLEAQGGQLDNAAKAMQLQQAQEVDALRQRAITETDPVLRQQLLDQLDLLMNKDGKFQVVQAGTGVIDERTLQEIKVPVKFNNRTGQTEVISLGGGIGGGMPQQFVSPDGNPVKFNPQTQRLEYVD